MGSSKKKPGALSHGGAHSNLPPEVAAAKAELIDVESKRTALVEELRLVEKQVKRKKKKERELMESSFFFLSIFWTSSSSSLRLSPLTFRPLPLLHLVPHSTPLPPTKQQQIYDLETRYLATANPAGTALKGYDGLLSSSGGGGGAGGGGGGGAAGRRPQAVKAEERFFSRSSTTGQPPGAK